MILRLQIKLIFIVILLPALAYDCDCESPIYNATYYQNLIQSSTTTIFTGRVKKKEKRIDQDEWAVTLKVFDSWKNAEQTEIVIYTKNEQCGYDFLKWRKYFVVGNQIGGEIRVGLCSATGGVRASSKHIKALDKIVSRKKIG